MRGKREMKNPTNPTTKEVQITKRGGKKRAECERRKQGKQRKQRRKRRNEGLTPLPLWMFRHSLKGGEAHDVAEGVAEDGGDEVARPEEDEGLEPPKHGGVEELEEGGHDGIPQQALPLAE